MFKTSFELLLQQFGPQPPNKSNAAISCYKAGTVKVETTILHPSHGLFSRCSVAVQLHNTKDFWCYVRFGTFFDDHVNEVVQACNYHLLSLQHWKSKNNEYFLCHSLTFDVANTLVVLWNLALQ